MFELVHNFVYDLLFTYEDPKFDEFSDLFNSITLIMTFAIIILLIMIVIAFVLGMIKWVAGLFYA